MNQLLLSPGMLVQLYDGDSNLNHIVHEIVCCVKEPQRSTLTLLVSLFLHCFWFYCFLCVNAWDFVMSSCCLCFEHKTGHPFLFCFIVNAFSELKGDCQITDERAIVEWPYKGESLRTWAGAAMNNCSIFDGVAILSPSVTVRYVLLKRFGRDSVSCTAAKFQPLSPSYAVLVHDSLTKRKCHLRKSLWGFPAFEGPCLRQSLYIIASERLHLFFDILHVLGSSKMPFTSHSHARYCDFERAMSNCWIFDGLAMWSPSAKSRQSSIGTIREMKRRFSTSLKARICRRSTVII